MTNALIASRDAFSATHREERIVVNDRSWGVLRVGDSGPALVLMPGTLGRADIFWNQIEALQNRVRILALTYPETGGVADWSADICVLMDKYGIDTATVLGSSLGGYVAQYMAGTHAIRIDNLVAANTLHSVAILSDIAPYNTNMEAAPIDALRRGFNDGLAIWAAEAPHVRDLIELLTLEVNGRIPEAELRTRLNALKHGPELAPAGLEKSNIYTVESSDDHLAPPPVRDAVRARLDPVRSFTFERGSHFPYVTHPAEYTEMLETILDLKPKKEATE